MDELIKRSDAIKAMAKAIGRIVYDAEAVSQHVMNSIPAVEPKKVCIGQIHFDDEKLHEIVDEAMKKLKEEIEPKQGEWIDIWEDGRSTKAVCNTCGRVSDRPLGDFCKWCGVTMKGADDE